jgi:hypothetical protein
LFLTLFFFQFLLPANPRHIYQVKSHLILTIYDYLQLNKYNKPVHFLQDQNHDNGDFYCRLNPSFLLQKTAKKIY